MKRHLVTIAGILSLICISMSFFGCAAAPPAPERLPAAERFRAKAAEYEAAGELRRALQMWEVVSAFRSPDEEAAAKVKKLKDRMRELSAQHFKQGVAHYGAGSIPAARKEFLITLYYDPDNSEALDYLKNRLAGETFSTYEVKKGDTVQKIAQKVYQDPKKDFLIAVFNDLGKSPQLAPGTKLLIPNIDTSLIEQYAETELAPSADAVVEDRMKPAEPEVPAPPAPVALTPLEHAQELLRTKRYAEAAAAADRLLEQDRGNTEAVEVVNAAHYQLGMTTSEEKRYKEALAHFKKVDQNYRNARELRAATERQLAEVHYLDGVRLFVNEKLEEAIREWEAALALNPDHPKARKDIENAQNLLKRLREAR